ncbi:hypothetical protein ALC56_07815 [Trachymyrmex septentrionalis]|uniref:Uncharacterized protein n=1 Tax=Trachymyrmex septentrionalis TaxID=34720 RepID=A0A195FB58_9HYME|nr:hypothetical protein ALC56_07815 [Trachymyrmex septentrionalis]
MFDAISGDAIRLKSQTVETIPSVLPAKWLVTRVPMSAHKAQCNTRGGFIRAWVISEEEKEEEVEEEKKEIDFAAPRTISTMRFTLKETTTARITGNYLPNDSYGRSRDENCKTPTNRTRKTRNLGNCK